MDGSKCHSIWPHHLTTPLDASAICIDYVNTTCMSTTNGSEAKYSNAQGQGKTPENNTKILFLSIQCEANNYSLESKTRKSDWTKLQVSYKVYASQQSSASASGVRGPRFKPHCRWLCLLWWPLRYSLRHGLCSSAAMLRSTQPSTLHGMAKWWSAYGLSNNN